MSLWRNEVEFGENIQKRKLYLPSDTTIIITRVIVFWLIIFNVERFISKIGLLRINKIIMKDD